MKILPLFPILAGMLLGACNPSPVTDAKKPDTDTVVLEGVIDTATARRLVKNFDGRAFRRKSGELIFNDTRCVWFSVKQLKSLLNRIEAEDGDGVRFYMAAYDRHKRPDVKIDSIYLDYSTLVMVSTRKHVVRKDSVIHKDYYYDKDGRRGAILTVTPENQGELCPPPAKCDEVGATLLQ